jgi:hypothetical protein
MFQISTLQLYFNSQPSGSKTTATLISPGRIGDAQEEGRQIRTEPISLPPAARKAGIFLFGTGEKDRQ